MIRMSIITFLVSTIVISFCVFGIGGYELIMQSKKARRIWDISQNVVIFGLALSIAWYIFVEL